MAPATRYATRKRGNGTLVTEVFLASPTSLSPARTNAAAATLSNQEPRKRLKRSNHTVTKRGRMFVDGRERTFVASATRATNDKPSPIEEDQKPKAQPTPPPRSSSLDTTQTKALADELMCPLCLDILVQPTTLVPCGHAVCAVCWAQQPSKTCAYCQAPVQTHAISLVLQQTIHKLVDLGEFFSQDDAEHYRTRMQNTPKPPPVAAAAAAAASPAPAVAASTSTVDVAAAAPTSPAAAAAASTSTPNKTRQTYPEDPLQRSARVHASPTRAASRRPTRDAARRAAPLIRAEVAARMERLRAQHMAQLQAAREQLTVSSPSVTPPTLAAMAAASASGAPFVRAASRQVARREAAADLRRQSGGTVASAIVID